MNFDNCFPSGTLEIPREEISFDQEEDSRRPLTERHRRRHTPDVTAV